MIRFMTLGDVCTDIIDCPHESPDWKSEGVAVIRNFNLVNGRIDMQDGYYVDEDTYIRRTRRAVPSEGDIIFSREAPIGNCAIVPKDFKCCLGQRLVLLRVNHSICSSEYLLAVLQSSYVMQQIEQVSKRGSIVSNFAIGDLRELVVPVLDDQNEIAVFSNTVSEKITNNNAFCSDLENMAKLLYDYWFVQFDFPDKSGKPYKSSGGKMVWNEELKREIPEGWEIKPLGEIIIEAPKSLVQVNEANNNGGYPFFTSGDAVLAHDEYFVDGFNCFLNTGGNPGIKGYKGECAYSTDTWCISSNEYSYMMCQYFKRIMLQFEQLFFAGSGLKHLQKDILKRQYIALPPQSIIDKYNKIMDTCWDENTTCIKENQQLASLRDFLLPMLMNGQVKVGKEGE